MVEEYLKFLADDEREAISGYDAKIKELEKLGDEYKHLIEQLKHIRDEEQKHLDFLEEAQKNPNATYEHNDNNSAIGNKYDKIVKKYILKDKEGEEEL